MAMGAAQEARLAWFTGGRSRGRAQAPRVWESAVLKKLIVVYGKCVHRTEPPFRAAHAGLKPGSTAARRALSNASRACGLGRQRTPEQALFRPFSVPLVLTSLGPFLFANGFRDFWGWLLWSVGGRFLDLLNIKKILFPSRSQFVLD